MIRTSFKTRLAITIILLVIGTVYVLSPNEFQSILLISYIIFLSGYLIAYSRSYERILCSIYKKKIKTPTQFSDFNSDTEKIFQSFTNQLENKIRIVFSDMVDDFESKSSHKIIYVNPKYVKQADKQEIEASLYHELGHIKKFDNYISDGILFSVISSFYGMIFPIIALAKGEFIIIPIISMLILIRLIMIIVSWRNEYRADKFAAEKVSLETMKKMFDYMPFKSDSESHPSPNRRLEKIIKSVN